jgi:hypothetical protein
MPHTVPTVSGDGGKGRDGNGDVPEREFACSWRDCGLDIAVEYLTRM